MRQPVLFVSHGAPTLALKPGAVGAAWQQAFADLPHKPKAILVISAHWGSHEPLLSSAPQPPTIHDFYGFPPPLYQMQYAAPGAPALAERTQQLMHEAGLSAALDAERGFDHGVWVPLQIMQPQADIPVFCLSLQPRRDAPWHYRVGQTLRALRDEGVLILGSGGITHNLQDLLWHDEGDSPAHAYAEHFQQWIADRLAQHAIEDLLHYRQRAPGALRAHPTDEHLLPLFVALGAAGENYTVHRFYQAIAMGAFALDAYQFD